MAIYSQWLHTQWNGNATVLTLYKKIGNDIEPRDDEKNRMKSVIEQKQQAADFLCERKPVKWVAGVPCMYLCTAYMNICESNGMEW